MITLFGGCLVSQKRHSFAGSIDTLATKPQNVAGSAATSDPMFQKRPLGECNGRLSVNKLLVAAQKRDLVKTKVRTGPEFQAWADLAAVKPADSHKHQQPLLEKAVDDALRRENDQLRAALALAEEKTKAIELESKLMRHDLVQLNAAYSQKCQESKTLQNELNTLHLQTMGGDDVRILQQNICRLEAAYAIKTQDNERLGGVIDALVDQRREAEIRSQMKYKF